MRRLDGETRYSRQERDKKQKKPVLRGGGVNVWLIKFLFDVSASSVRETPTTPEKE